MTQAFGKLLRKASRRLSWIGECLESSVSYSEMGRHRDCFETVRELLRFYQPRTLFDIGANDGTWFSMVRHLCPSLAQVVAFEPQAQFHERLRGLTRPDFDVLLYGCALGDRAGSGVIKGGTASASLLAADRPQTHFFPESIHDRSEVTQVMVLDDIYRDDRLPTPDVIKIDVQGYELNALKGSVEVLKATRILVVELSCRPFYEKQSSLSQLLAFLEDRHFVLAARGYEWRSPTAPSELLQFDGIFINSSL